MAENKLRCFYLPSEPSSSDQVYPEPSFATQLAGVGVRERPG